MYDYYDKWSICDLDSLSSVRGSCNGFEPFSRQFGSAPIIWVIFINFIWCLMCFLSCYFRLCTEQVTPLSLHSLLPPCVEECCSNYFTYIFSCAGFPPFPVKEAQLICLKTRIKNYLKFPKLCLRLVQFEVDWVPPSHGTPDDLEKQTDTLKTLLEEPSQSGPIRCSSKNDATKQKIGVNRNRITDYS